MGRWWHKRMEIVDNFSACAWSVSCWVSLNTCFDYIWWKINCFNVRNIIITIVSYVRECSLVKSTKVPGKTAVYVFKMTLFYTEDGGSSSIEMLVVFYQVIRCRIWEDHNIGAYCRCCHVRSQILAVYPARLFWTRVLKILIHVHPVSKFYFTLTGE
jgi:hypothetical protein